MSDNIYCPFCGALQEKGQKFCGSCGASIEGQTSDNDQNVKIVGETPIATPPPPGYQQPGQQPSQQPYTYGAQPTHTQPTPQKKSDKALIGLILGIATIITQCFILPIVGLVMVKQARDSNEDQGLIIAATIVNWIMLFIYLIGPIVFFILYFSLGWYFLF